MKNKISKLRIIIGNKAHHYKSLNHKIYDLTASTRKNLRTTGTD